MAINRPFLVARRVVTPCLRPWRWVLVALLSAGIGCAQAESGVVTRPFHGITLIVRQETSPRPLRWHVVRVDLEAQGIAFALTPPAGGRDAIRQTTLAFLNEQRAQVAINAHFFVPFPSSEREVDLVGLAVAEGVVYSPFEPQPVKPHFVDQSYAILPFAPAMNLDRGNRVAIVRRDPTDPDNRRVQERVTLWTAFSGSAQIVTDGRPTIPRYSGGPAGLNATATYSDRHSWYGIPRARTAVGIAVGGKTLVLFVADQAAGSAGMTVGEVAEVLVSEYHVRDALNLDGGGSSTLAMQDPATGAGRIVNVPSDGPTGRAVGSSLAVFARPADSAPSPR